MIHTIPATSTYTEEQNRIRNKRDGRTYEVAVQTYEIARRTANNRGVTTHEWSEEQIMWLTPTAFEQMRTLTAEASCEIPKHKMRVISINGVNWEQPTQYLMPTVTASDLQKEAIAKMQAENKAEMEALRAESKAEIEALRTEMEKKKSSGRPKSVTESGSNIEINPDN